MARPLRELFAEFKIKVIGRKNLERSNRALEKTKRAAEKTRSGVKKLVEVYKKIEKVIDAFQKLVNILNILKGLSGLNFGRRIEQQSNRAARSVNRMSSSVGRFGSMISGTVIVYGLNRFIRGLIAAGDEFDKVSQQIGLTTEQFQAYSHAANLAGVNSTEFSNAVGQLQRRANDAAEGSQESADAFRQLGVEVKDSNGNLIEGDELLKRVADGLKNTSNSSLRTALSMELMGRNGRKLLPMLTGGREAVEKMAAELDELGGGLSAEAVRGSVELTDNITRLNLAFMSMKNVVAISVLPQIDFFVQKATDLAVWLADIGKNSQIVNASVITLAGTLAGIAISTIALWAPFAALGAAFLGTVLIIDDILVAMKGGESTIAGFVERLFEWEEGEGLQFFQNLYWSILRVISAFKKGSTVSEALNSALGEISGRSEKGDSAISAFLQGLMGLVNGIKFLIGAFKQLRPVILYFISFMRMGFQMAENLINNISRLLDKLQMARSAIQYGFGSLSGFQGLLGEIPGVGRLFTREGPAVQPMTTTTTTSSRRGGTNVNAGVNVGNITINGDNQDPGGIRRAIDQAINEAALRQARQLQEALVSDGKL